MGQIVYLSNVRVSFPHLTKPHASTQNGEVKYQLDMIMSPDSEAWKTVWEAVGKAAQDTWGDQAGAMINLLQQERMKRSYGSGDEKINRETMQVLDGYAGNYFLNAKSKDKPDMVKADGTKSDPANTMEYQELAGAIYGGCYINAVVDIYPVNKPDIRGIFAGLHAIQFLKDGEAFGDGKVDVTPMFGAVAQSGSTQASPAGMPASNAPTAPFGQPKSDTPAPGMPAAPFGDPGVPNFMGGDDQ